MRIQLRNRRLNFFDRAHANNLGQTFADAKGKVQFASADNSAIDIDQINDAYERILKSDVKYQVRHRHGQNKMTCAGLDGMFLSNSC
jgi:hypothetical protein